MDLDLKKKQKEDLQKELSLLMHQYEIGDIFYIIINFTFQIKCFFRKSTFETSTNDFNIASKELRFMNKTFINICDTLGVKLNYDTPFKSIPKKNIKTKIDYVNIYAFSKFYTYCIYESNEKLNMKDSSVKLSLFNHGNITNIGSKYIKNIQNLKKKQKNQDTEQKDKDTKIELLDHSVAHLEITFENFNSCLKVLNFGKKHFRYFYIKNKSIFDYIDNNNNDSCDIYYMIDYDDETGNNNNSDDAGINNNNNSDDNISNNNNSDDDDDDGINDNAELSEISDNDDEKLIEIHDYNNDDGDYNVNDFEDSDGDDFNDDSNINDYFYGSDYNSDNEVITSDLNEFAHMKLSKNNNAE